MNFFWRWVQRRLYAADREPVLSKNAYKTATTVGIVEESMGDKKIDFTMMFAEGGMIVQTYQYDRIKDRTYRKLTLIRDDEDVATRVGEIVAMEIMRA